MEKLTFELQPKQAEQLVGQLVQGLDPAAKLRLAERLDRETRRTRWEPLVMKMKKRFAERPLSPREIRHLCEQVRSERFRRAAGRS